MQFLATAQPHVVQCDGPRQHTTLLTCLERTEFVDDLASGALGVLPLCIDHAGGDDNTARAGDGDAATVPFVVPGSLVIGRIVHAAVRPNGQLLVLGELWFERPESKEIVADIREKKRWGVSLCTNLVVEADLTKVLSKRVTHVGVTRDPEYGDLNTWIHLAATNWPAFYRYFATDYVAKEPGMYMSQSLRDMITPYLIEAKRAPVKPQQPQQQLQQQVCASRHRESETSARLGGPRLANEIFHPSTIQPFYRNRTMSDLVGNSGAGPESTRQSREEVVRNIQNFFKTLVEKSGATNVTDLPVSSNNIVQANNLLQATMNYLKQEKIADDPNAWGGDILSSITDLRNYHLQSVGATNKFADDLYANDPDVKAQIKQALNNPMLPENLPLVSQVMATRAASLVNQGQKEEQIRKAVAEVKLRDEDILKKNKELEDFKLRMIQAEEKTQRLLEQIALSAQQSAVSEPDSKRMRLDNNNNNNNNNNAPLTIDVGASQHSRNAGLAAFSDHPNGRLITPTHGNMNKYIPSSSPVLNDLVKGGYLAPWSNQATNERIRLISGNTF